MRIAFKLRRVTKTSFFGKTHTIEAINKISVKNSLPVKITDIETNTVKLFASKIKAAE